eukprot:2528037-Prymnesium_polylepis.1
MTCSRAAARAAAAAPSGSPLKSIKRRSASRAMLDNAPTPAQRWPPRPSTASTTARRHVEPSSRLRANAKTSKCGGASAVCAPLCPPRLLPPGRPSPLTSPAPPEATPRGAAAAVCARRLQVREGAA